MANLKGHNESLNQRIDRLTHDTLENLKIAAQTITDEHIRDLAALKEVSELSTERLFSSAVVVLVNNLRTNTRYHGGVTVALTMSGNYYPLGLCEGELLDPAKTYRVRLFISEVTS